jgi:glutaredoxin
MKKTLLIASMLVLINVSALADTLYRWVDSEGKVHYGDRPEEDAAKVEQKKFVVPNVGDEDLFPYETRQARQNFPVTLFVQESCGDICAQARAFLNKRGVPFDEKLLVTQEEVESFKKISGGNSIPTVAIGKTYLQGFEQGQWGNELDVAGYPKVAPYGVKPMVPPPKPVPAESAVAPVAPAP